VALSGKEKLEIARQNLKVFEMQVSTKNNKFKVWLSNVSCSSATFDYASLFFFYGFICREKCLHWKT
jgi:hypothetical protein